MATHELKIWPKQFEAISEGHKTYELRRDDRSYIVNDMLLLNEWLNDEGRYSGAQVKALVTHITYGVFGLKKGYVCMAIKLLEA